MSNINKKLSCKYPMNDEFKDLFNMVRRLLYWQGFITLDPEHNLEFYLDGFPTRVKDFFSSHLQFMFQLRQFATLPVIAMSVVNMVVIHPAAIFVYWDDKAVVIDNFFIMNMRGGVLLCVITALYKKEMLNNILLAIESLGGHLYNYHEDQLKKLRFAINAMTKIVKCLHYIACPTVSIVFTYYCVFYCLPNRVNWFRGWYPFEITSSPTLEIILTMSVVDIFLHYVFFCSLASTMLIGVVMIFLQFALLTNNTEIISEIARNNCSSASGDLRQFRAATHPGVMSLANRATSSFVPERCGNTGRHGYIEDGSVEGLPPVTDDTATNTTQVHGNIESPDEHHIITVTEVDDQGGSSEELCISTLSPQEITNTNVTPSQRNRFNSLSQRNRFNSRSQRNWLNTLSQINRVRPGVNLVERRNVQCSENDYTNALQNLLITYVQHHSLLILIVKQVNTYLRFFFLYMFFQNMAVFTSLFLILQIDTMPIPKKVWYISLSPTALALLLFVCIVGDKITDQSEGMGEALYFSDWLDTSPRYKKAMLIIMAQANKPVVLKAQGFSPFSLKFFGELTDWIYKLLTNAANFVTLN